MSVSIWHLAFSSDISTPATPDLSNAVTNTSDSRTLNINHFISNHT